MKKDNLKSIIVLSVICLVVAIAMAAVNYITAPVIKDNDDKKVQDSLKAVMPEAEGFETVEVPENAPNTVTSVFKETSGMGYAITVSTTSSYSKNPMMFTVGLSTEGKIIDVEMTGYSETKDFGKDTYPATYIGVDGAGVNEVALCSGVTYSSTAFRNAMADAFTVFDMIGGAE